MNDWLNSQVLQDQDLDNIKNTIPELTMFNMLLRNILRWEDYSNLVDLLWKVRQKNSWHN